MSAGLKETYKNMRSRTRIPWWTFSGIIFLMVCVFLGINQSAKHAQLNTQRVASPQKGDVYTTVTDGQYSLMKVVMVSNDTVYMIPHKYMTNKRAGLNGLIKQGEEGYEKGLIIGLTRKMLMKKLEEGEIDDITRE